MWQPSIHLLADPTNYAGLLSNTGKRAYARNILYATASAVGVTNTTNDAKASVTSAKATPISGSKNVATAAVISSSAKATQQ